MKYDFYFNRIRDIAYIFSFDAQDRKIYNLYFEYLPVYEISVSALKMIENRRAADKSSSANILLQSLNSIGINKRVKNNIEIFNEVIKGRPYLFAEIYNQECLSILYSVKSIIKTVEKLENEIIKKTGKILKLEDTEALLKFLEIMEDNFKYNEIYKLGIKKLDYEEINLYKLSSIFLENDQEEFYKKNSNILEAIYEDVNNLRNIKQVCQDIYKDVVMKNIQQTDRTDDITKNGLKQLDKEEIERIYCVSKMLEQESINIIKEWKRILEPYEFDASIYKTITQVDLPIIEFKNFNKNKLFDIIHDMNNIKFNLYIDIDNSNIYKYKVNKLEFTGLEFIHRKYSSLDTSLIEYNFNYVQLLELSYTNNIQHNNIKSVDVAILDTKINIVKLIDNYNKDVYNLTNKQTESINNDTLYYKLLQLDTSVNENIIFFKRLLEIDNNDGIIYNNTYIEIGNNDTLFIGSKFLDWYDIDTNKFDINFIDSGLSDLNMLSRMKSIDQLKDINFIKTKKTNEQYSKDIQNLTLYKALEIDNVNTRKMLLTNIEKTNKDLTENEQLNINVSGFGLFFSKIIYPEFGEGININILRTNDVDIGYENIINYKANLLNIDNNDIINLKIPNVDTGNYDGINFKIQNIDIGNYDSVISKIYKTDTGNYDISSFKTYSIDIDGNDIFKYKILNIDKNDKDFLSINELFSYKPTNDTIVVKTNLLNVDDKEFNAINDNIAYTDLGNSFKHKTNYLENFDKIFITYSYIPFYTKGNEINYLSINTTDFCDEDFYLTDNNYLSIINRETSRNKIILIDNTNKQFDALNISFSYFSSNELIINHFNNINKEYNSLHLYEDLISHNYSTEIDKYNLYNLSVNDKILDETKDIITDELNQNSIYYKLRWISTDVAKSMDVIGPNITSMIEYESNNMFNNIYLYIDNKDFNVISDKSLLLSNESFDIFQQFYKYFIFLDKDFDEYQIKFSTIDSYNIIKLNQDFLEGSFKDFNILTDSSLPLFTIESSIIKTINLLEQDSKQLYNFDIVETKKFPQEGMIRHSKGLFQDNRDFSIYDLLETTKQSFESNMNVSFGVNIDTKDFIITDIFSTKSKENEIFSNIIFNLETQEKFFDNHLINSSVYLVNNEININQNNSFTYNDKDFINIEEKSINIMNNSILNMSKYIFYEMNDKNFDEIKKQDVLLTNNNINIININIVEVSQKNMFEIELDKINNTNIDSMNFNNKYISSRDKTFDEKLINFIKEENLDILNANRISTYITNKDFFETKEIITNLSYIDSYIYNHLGLEQHSKLFDINELTLSDMSKQDLLTYKELNTVISNKEFDEVYFNLYYKPPSESNLFLIKKIEKINNQLYEETLDYLFLNKEELSIFNLHSSDNINKTFEDYELTISEGIDLDTVKLFNKNLIQENKVLYDEKIYFANSRSLDTNTLTNKILELKNKSFHINDNYYFNSEKLESNLSLNRYLDKNSKLFYVNDIDMFEKEKTDVFTYQYFNLIKENKNIDNIEDKYLNIKYNDLYKLHINIYDKSNKNLSDFNINIINTDSQNANVIRKLSIFDKKEKDFNDNFNIINSTVVAGEFFKYKHKEVDKTNKNIEENIFSIFNTGSIDITNINTFNLIKLPKNFFEYIHSYSNSKKQDVYSISPIFLLDTVKVLDTMNNDSYINLRIEESYFIEIKDLTKIKEFNEEENNIYVNIGKLDINSIELDGVIKNKDLDETKEDYLILTSKEIQKLSSISSINKTEKEYEEYFQNLVIRDSSNILSYNLKANIEQSTKHFMVLNMEALKDSERHISILSNILLNKTKNDLFDINIDNLYQFSQEAIKFVSTNSLHQIDKQFNEYLIRVQNTDKLNLNISTIKFIQKDNKLLEDNTDEKYLNINIEEIHALENNSLIDKLDKHFDELRLKTFSMNKIELIKNKYEILSIDKKDFNNYNLEYHNTKNIEQFRYKLFSYEIKDKNFEESILSYISTDKQNILSNNYTNVILSNKMFEDYNIFIPMNIDNKEAYIKKANYIEIGNKLFEEYDINFLNESSNDIINITSYHEIQKMNRNLEEFTELDINIDYIETDRSSIIPLIITKKEKEFSIEELVNLYQENYEIFNDNYISLDKSKKDLEEIEIENHLIPISTESHKYIYKNMINMTKEFDEFCDINYSKNFIFEANNYIFKQIEKGKRIFDEIEFYLSETDLIDINILHYSLLEQTKKSFDEQYTYNINIDMANLSIYDLYWIEKYNKEFDEGLQQFIYIKASEIDNFSLFNVEKLNKMFDELILYSINTSFQNLNKHNIYNLSTLQKELYQQDDGSIKGIQEDTIKYNYINIDKDTKLLSEVLDSSIDRGILNITSSSITFVDDRIKDFEEFKIFSIKNDGFDLIDFSKIQLIENKNKELKELETDLNIYIGGLMINNNSLNKLIQIDKKDFDNLETEKHLSDSKTIEINKLGVIKGDRNLEVDKKDLNEIHDDLLSKAYEEVLTDKSIKYFYAFIEEIISKYYNNFMEEVEEFLDFNDNLDKDTSLMKQEIKIFDEVNHLEEIKERIDLNDKEINNMMKISPIEIDQIYSSRNDLEEKEVNFIDFNGIEDGVSSGSVEIENYFKTNDFLEETAKNKIDIQDNLDNGVDSGSIEIYQYYTSKNDLEEIAKQQIDISEQKEGLSSGLIEINNYFISDDFLEDVGYGKIDYKDQMDEGLSSGKSEIDIISISKQLENSSENEVFGFKKYGVTSHGNEIDIFKKIDSTEETFINNDNEIKETDLDFLSTDKVEILYSKIRKSVEEFIDEEFEEGNFIKPIDKGTLEILNTKLKKHISDTSQEILPHNGDRVETGKRGFDFRLKDYWSQDWVWLTARKSSIGEFVDLRRKAMDDFQNNLKLVLNSNIKSFPSKGSVINEIVYMWMKNTMYDFTYVDEIELLSRALMYNIKDDIIYDKTQLYYIIDIISQRYNKEFIEGFLSLTLYEGHIEAKIRLKAMLNFYTFLEQLIHVNRGYLNVVSTQEGVELITKILRKWIETETNELTEQDVKDMGNHEKLIELLENSLPIDYEYLVRWFEWYCDQEIFLNGHDFEKNAYESLCNIRDRMISYFNTHWGIRKTNYTEAIEKYEGDEDLLSYVLRPEVIVDKSVVDKIRGNKHGRLSRVLSHLIGERGQSSLKGWIPSGGGQYMIDYDPNNPTGDFNIGDTKRSNMRDFYHIGLEDLVDTHVPPHVEIEDLANGNQHDLIYKISEIEVYKEE